MILLKIVEKKFRLFDYRCVYDIKYVIMENDEEVVLTITLGYIEYKSQFHGTNRKVKNASKKGFRFSEKLKLTIKIDLSLSNIDIC